MATIQAVTWFNEVSMAVSQYDGESLAELLHFGRQAQARCTSLVALVDAGQLEQTARNVQAPFKEIVLNHVRCFYFMKKDEPIKGLKAQLEASDVFFNVLNNESEHNVWWLAPLDAVHLQLRRVSYKADEELERRKEKPKHIVEAQDMLKRFFQKMIIDRSASQSKKMGCLAVTVHLFKIYFKINNLRLCSNLITVVNNPMFPKFELFPAAQTVAYNYYLGRLMVFEEQYAKAEAALSFAFKHCHKDSEANKRRILQFLIPVRLLMGQCPQPQLLQRYNLPQFSSLVASISSGQLAHFNQALEEFQEFFIQKGIFLILEKLKTHVYRNLFKKCYQYWQSTCTDAKKQNQLPLTTMQAALRMYGQDMDTDELECVLANLIFHGNIKGYLAHKRCLVLSKVDPFPKSS